MKIKAVYMKIADINTFHSDVEEAIEKPIRNKQNNPTLYVEDINAFKKILSEERLKILSTIRHRKPKSIYELSKLLNRDRRNVIADLNVLRNAGFVELQEEKGIRSMTKPVADYDRLDISIEL